MNGHIAIEPMGAVRMTQNDKFKPSAQRYFAYKNVIGHHLRRQQADKQSLELPIEITLTFNMPIPASYSLKKRQELIGQPHMLKPDIDNLIKGFCDSANGILWTDDKLICKCDVIKVYAVEPGIEWEVKPFEQAERVEPAVQQGAQGGVRRPKQSGESRRATVRIEGIRKALR